MPEENVTLKQANKALRALPGLAKDELQKTFDTTAFQVSRRMASLAPVMAQPDKRRQPGQLRRAIGWKSRPGSLSAVVTINTAMAYWWKFVEFGTVKMSAQPFARPSADAERSDHNARTTRALETAGARMSRGDVSTSANTGSGQL